MKFTKFYKGLFATAALSTLILTGCNNGSGEDSGADSSEGSGDVTIRVAWWGGQARHDRTLEVIELFEEQYPNIHVEAEFTNWDGYWQRLNTQVAGNDLPDVVQMDITRISEFASNGLLADLTTFIDDGVIDLSDVDLDNQGILQIDDEALGISSGANAFAFIYNHDLATELGFGFEPGYTWDELLEFLSTAREELGDDFYGVNFAGTEFEVFQVFLRQAGEFMYSDDGSSIAFDEKTLIDYFTLIQYMNNNNLAVTPEIEASIVENATAIGDGTSIAIPVSSNQIVGVQDGTEANLGLSLLPMSDTDEPGHWLRYSVSFAVASGSEQQEAAAKFIDFITNDVEANEILLAERGVPISSVVREAIRGIVPETVQETFDYLDVVSEFSSEAAPIPPAGDAEVRNIFGRHIEKLRFNTITPDEAAQGFIEEANQVLK